MISIVVCSINESMFASFTESVSNTIGVPFEIIRIDNNLEKLGICAAYNRGALMANYEIICFSHEDIFFDTLNWGKIVVDEFTKNPNLGALGVAGSTYHAKTPTGWGVDAIHNKSNVTMGTATQKYGVNYFNSGNDVLVKVVQLDGLWICASKSVWKEVRFNEKDFPKFHYYDIDFTLRVHLAGYDVCVTYKIDMRHASGGSFNAEWIRESKLFLQKWENRLPVSVNPKNKQEIRELEYNTNEVYFDFLLGITKKKHSLIYLKGCLRANPLHPSNFKKITKWFLWNTPLERYLRNS